MPARHREVLTAMGVNQLTITRHPVGALMIFPRPAWEAFRERVAALPMDANPSTAHMFIVNPLRGSGWLTLFSTHPPIAERVARLRAMRIA